MSGTKTLIWAVVLVVLATLYYFYDIRGGQRRHEAARQDALLVQVQPEEVTGLSLERASETITAVKRQGRWQLTAPLSAPGDPRKLDTMVRSLAELQVLRTVTEQPDALASFGLADPRLTVRLQRPAPSEAVTVRLGNRNPTGSGYYARVEGQAPVYLIPSTAENDLNASVYDLRDKTVLTFPLSEVQEVRIESATTPAVHLQRQDDAWQLTAPVQDRADAQQVRRLLQGLRDVEVQAFVAETPSDLAPYGLAKPRWRVSLTVGPERTTTTLLLGSTADDGQGVYAKRDAAANVVVLPPQFWHALPTTVAALRDKKLLRFDPAAVQQVQLRYPETTLQLERRGDTWHLTAPETTPLQERWSVDALLYDLSTLEYVRRLPEATADEAEVGLQAPRVQITVWTEAAEPLPPLLIGQTIAGVDDDTEDLVYARVGTEPPLYAIDGQILDDLPSTPSDLSAAR